MPKLSALVVVALGLASLVGCASAWRVPPERAQAMVKEGAALVDVRSPDEFAAGHLEGAKNIPVDELAGRLAEVGPKDAPVVLYCRSGMRSGKAAKLLVDAGFSQVADLGPMSAWPKP